MDTAANKGPLDTVHTGPSYREQLQDYRNEPPPTYNTKHATLARKVLRQLARTHNNSPPA